MGPLLIFHHIPKTAGTSLLHVLRRNYPDGELLELYGRRDAPPPPANATEFAQLLASLEPERRVRVRCIAGHSANLAIPALEEPLRLFTMFRDPVDRVISIYHFIKDRPELAGGGGIAGKIIRERNLSIPDIFRSFDGRLQSDDGEDRVFGMFFNGQARTMLRLPLPFGRKLPMVGLPANHEEIEEALDELLAEHYVIGSASRYEDSVRMLASRFGWSDATIVRNNVTPRRPAVDELPSEVVEMIRAYNPIDEALNQRALREVEIALAAQDGGSTLK